LIAVSLLQVLGQDLRILEGDFLHFCTIGIGCIFFGPSGFRSFPLVDRFSENQYATLVLDEFPDRSASVGQCPGGTQQQCCPAEQSFESWKRHTRLSEHPVLSLREFVDDPLPAIDLTGKDLEKERKRHRPVGKGYS
jgi:hypothetical protein